MKHAERSGRTSVVVGIDVGTSVVKAVAFADDGSVVGLVRRPNSFTVPESRWAECDMDGVWMLVAECLRELTSLLPDGGASIIGIGVSGNMGGAWLLDGAGNPVRPAILWNDGRSARILADWRDAGLIERIFAVSCNTPAPGFTLPVLAWLKRFEPQSLQRAKHLLFSKDWVRYRLTGELSTDESDASHIPGSAIERGYSEELHLLAGIPELARLLLPLCGSGEVAGRIHQAAADATGLPKGTPVITGLADVTAMLTGAGATEPGCATVVLGTSCLNSVTTAAPLFEPHNVGLSFLMPENRWTRTLSNQTGTLALTWFWREFMQPSERSQSPSFSALEDMARSSTLGANGLVFHPYLNATGITGPVYEPTARARIWGLGVEHTRNDILRAVYEGVALSIGDCFQLLPEFQDPVRLLGGGARSTLWPQMLADVLNRPVEVTRGEEFGALGVAMMAGIATGVWDSLRDATAASKTHSEPVVPDPERHERYSRLLEVFQFLRRDLAAERSLGGEAWRG